MDSECSIMLDVAFHFTFFTVISKHKPEVMDLLFATNNSASSFSWGKLAFGIMLCFNRVLFSFNKVLGLFFIYMYIYINPKHTYI